VLTYANQLTILRMIFIPCFVLLAIYGYPRSAMIVFVTAAVTDAFDGLLARKLKQRTSLGSYLDPMADKLLIAAAFVTLTIPSVPVALHIPVWLTITAFSRDLLIALAVLIIHLHTGHTHYPPTSLGKITTTLQLVTVALALLANFTPKLSVAIFMPVVYSTLLFTVISGLHYFYRAVKVIDSYTKTGTEDGQKRA